MQTSDSTPGITLQCNQDGVVVKVLQDGFGIAHSEILGKPFPMLVANSSFQKALSFLVLLKATRMVFDWEFDLSLGDKIVRVRCDGSVIEDGLLILAAQMCSSVNTLYEEMTRINNDQTNLLRTIVKDQGDMVKENPEREIGLYDGLSSLNNELVTLQRELAQKNVELERLNAEVRRLAIVDELTQVYNRRGFFEMGNREVERAKRFGKPLSAIMFDIDHFRSFNNTYGHAIGDRVLTEVAARCSRQLRKVDIFGRYGGEEFVVLLPETKIADAAVAAEHLRHHTAYEPVSTEQGLLTVTISLGIAVLKNNTTGLEELLERADQALYKAKTSGRNRVCVDGA
jgi:diguanylate cyclase (GGDEF)-like protein